MSLRIVPELVRSVFQKFPVTQYPPVSTGSPDSESLLLQRKIYLQSFGSSDSVVENSFFTLGVYGMFRYLLPDEEYDRENQLLLATDPTCLFVQLSLIARNGLRFPASESQLPEHKPRGQMTQQLNSILIMSYHGSKDGELPILIENSNYGKSNYKRITRSNHVINELSLARIEEGKEFIVTEFMDKVLYDAWTFTVVTELSYAEILEIYACVEENDPIVKPNNKEGGNKNNKGTSSGLDSALSGLVVKELVFKLVQRNQFSLRYPTVAANFHKWLPNYRPFISGWLHRNYSKSADHKLSQEIQDIFGQLAEHLPAWKRILVRKLEDSKDGKVEFFTLKLASYLVCVKRFMKGKKIFEIIESSSPELFNLCDKVLKKLVK